MTETMQMVAAVRLLDRARLAQAAEWLAVAVAVSLPWSTSASGILIALWLLAFLPTLDPRALRWALVIPAAALPVALFALTVLGMGWSNASLVDQIGSVKPVLRLLAIPLLFVQFSSSDRGMRVVGGFLASCTMLLVLSWVLWTWPPVPIQDNGFPAVPVKDYIIQSGEFLVCTFAFAHLSITAAREGRRARALVLALLAMGFFTNIVFVATGRSTLVVFAALLPILAIQRFDWRGVIGIVMAGATLAAIAWMSSPYLRLRVQNVAQEIHLYRTANAETSAGYRLEFWTKSIRFITAAPVFGHGTGSVMDLFREAATGDRGPSAAITDQPHNQTFIVAIQLGLLGAALLFAMWISHLLLFRGGGLAAWLGTGVVVQNIVSCLFNSYLFEFTMGWIYVFGVGVLGGMMLRGVRQPDSRPAP
jgi:O-antigen ligase